MIDERFGLAAFEGLGRNSLEAEKLAQQLAQAIGYELADDLRRLGGRIAARLRELGHAVYEVDSGPWSDGGAEASFVDASDGTGREQHKLRFSLDLVVSAGFPGYSDIE